MIKFCEHFIKFMRSIVLFEKISSYDIIFIVEDMPSGHFYPSKLNKSSFNLGVSGVRFFFFSFYVW